MTDQYLVTTPHNPHYTGKAYGVFFRGGRAFVSEHTIDPSLGWSVEEVVKKLQDDFGYSVERVGGAKLDLFNEEHIEVAPLDTKSKKRNKAAAAVAAEVPAE